MLTRSGVVASRSSKRRRRRVGGADAGRKRCSRNRFKLPARFSSEVYNIQKNKAYINIMILNQKYLRKKMFSYLPLKLVVKTVLVVHHRAAHQLVAPLLRYPRTAPLFGHGLDCGMMNRAAPLTLFGVMLVVAQSLALVLEERTHWQLTDLAEVMLVVEQGFALVLVEGTHWPLTDRAEVNRDH
jgi:hypothetical protein